MRQCQEETERVPRDKVPKQDAGRGIAAAIKRLDQQRVDDEGWVAAGEAAADAVAEAEVVAARADAVAGTCSMPPG
jgi:hypothetical protein